MKLTAASLKSLDLLIQTALTAGIKKLIIEGDKIRGIDEKQSVVIITTDQVPDLDGKMAGINRVDQLAARINLVKSQGDLNIEATESPNGQDISLLDISAGKTKAQFRCASVEAVKGVPKNITDTLVWDLSVTSKILPVLTQGVSAMSADLIIMASRDGTSVSFECVDGNKDVFTAGVDGVVTWVGTGAPATSFCHKYPAKTFLSLLKEATKTTDPVQLKLGEGGILSLKVNGFCFYLIPAA